MSPPPPARLSFPRSGWESRQGEALTPPTIRLDKFLWFTRLAKSRSLAQHVAESGHLRIGGRTVDRAHCPVRVGDVLTFALDDRVRIVRVEALPTRRSPGAEARLSYTDLSPGVDEPTPPT